MASGLLIGAVFFSIFIAFTAETSYYVIAAGIVAVVFGMGIAMTPATSAVMGAVPGGHLGVGSAMNDATREIGNALGIGVMGSVANGIYFAGIKGAVVNLPVEAAAVARDSVGGALGVAAQLEEVSAQALVSAGTGSFMDALGIAFAGSGVAAALAAILVLKFMPHKAAMADDDVGVDEENSVLAPGTVHEPRFSGERALSNG